MKLTCLENVVRDNSEHSSCFLIEPLEVGQGITIGNSLRRTLLSDLSGYAITGVRINNLKHEFSTIHGIREDVLETLLNLKEVVLKDSTQLKIRNDSQIALKGYLNVKGPMVVTAGMFQLPKGLVTIVNPQQYICTLVRPCELYMEIDIERGKGYQLVEESRKTKISEKFFPDRPTTILVDSLFIPVRKINFKLRLIHDTKGNLKESLLVEITTNGSLTPQRALQEALKILMDGFYSLFLSTEFGKGNQSFIKNFLKDFS